MAIPSISLGRFNEYRSLDSTLMAVWSCRVPHGWLIRRLGDSTKFCELKRIAGALGSSQRRSVTNCANIAAQLADERAFGYGWMGSTPAEGDRVAQNRLTSSRVIRTQGTKTHGRLDA
jgi:hypothetical protein